MTHKYCIIALIGCAAAQADFSYDQTSRITGGAMAGMMKMAGAFSKAARDPMASHVMLKGDRMATVSGNHISIIDLSTETFTDINLEKKEYSTATFDEMKRAMEKVAARMQSKKETSAEVSFKADVKETGAAKIISGLQAKQILLTLTMDATDKGESGQVKMMNEMWMAPTVPGYEEIRAFYARMAEKMDWSALGNMARAMTAQQPGMEKGMAEMAKQMSKLDGLPVLQITRMGGSADGMPSEAQMQAAQQQPAQSQQQAQGPDVKEAAAAAALGRTRLGGLAGGFGGFGRKKKQSEAVEAAPAPAQPTSGTTAAGAGYLMEITTELSGFSSSAIDGSKMDVPAGFKKVEHSMSKAANQ